MEKNQKIIMIWIEVILLMLAVLFYFLPMNGSNLDSIILLFFQETIRNPVLNPIFAGITTLGNAGAIWIILSILLCIPKKTRQIGIISICALLGSFLINNLILKNLVGRIRPYEVIDGLVPLVAKPVDASFPSGHAGSSFASGWVLFRNLPKRFGVPVLILAILIACSRLYVGVHYPTDVLIGTMNGIGIACLAQYLLEPLFRHQFPNLYAPDSAGNEVSKYKETDAD